MWEEPVGKLADLRQVCMPDAPDDVQGANPALRKRRLSPPLDAGSTEELQQVALAVVDLVNERVV
ncbi:hypothetical protein AVHY2522_24380 [Acidovorax sp. SUPP2522]|uniref:hypothetical protein n=1 Tax=Acidovorax sp. SUPP2522 TaxID=511900 RepID=UPI0023DE2E5A|nr:hypothetical protein [Acidovorax sp. SUPP2522]GKT19958.1 hypothetical protein AVHY2522_24380 [Acidovorax sp. SUPP2522]